MRGNERMGDLMKSFRVVRLDPWVAAVLVAAVVVAGSVAAWWTDGANPSAPSVAGSVVPAADDLAGAVRTWRDGCSGELRIADRHVSDDRQTVTIRGVQGLDRELLAGSRPPPGNSSRPSAGCASRLTAFGSAI